MARLSRLGWDRQFEPSREIEEGRVIAWRTSYGGPKSVLRWTTDFVLGVIGAVAALASATFAVVMIQANITNPTFGGSEYLLLFTRPLQPVGRPGWAVAAHSQPRGIDFAATGSIGAAARQATAEETADTTQKVDQPGESPEPPILLKDYVVQSVRAGIAVIRGPKGLFMVENGSLMPDGQLVVSIDRRAGHWIVVTSDGIVNDQ